MLATVVYGANDTISRRGLWQKLVLLANSISDEPWIVGGDFNTVLDMSEVCGSSADIRLAMTEFRDCLLDTGLIHLPVQGERFSWHNCSEGDRSLWKRLDRLLVNDAWLSQWPNSHYHCLNARTSDHSPLVIRGDTATHTISMFRFDNYLTMSSDFTPSVQNIWRHRIEGTAMYAVTRKLRALKFRSLRRKKGDLSLNVKLAAESLSYKAGAKHAATTGENSMAKGWRSVLPDLLPKATARGERRREFLDLRHLRPWARHVVTPDECMELVQSVTREEIKDAFFDIAEDKAPGPDGYSSGFYKAAWPVIGEEVVKAILEFFTTGRLLKQVNTTILALIPKVRVPSLVSDFRPISCCNVLYKVITKIIVQRLRLVLDKMINPAQNAFVPGRSIGDNILLAQEMFSGYNRQGLPMRCALKVDLRKAYDTVEWDFLSAVLHLFGFPDIFIGWIEECVTTPMFSVCINGNPHGFFKGSRGLRQGDPMSPFLFVLIMEVLQLMLQQLIDQNEGFSFHWRCKEIGLFQLCFADDLLLFCKADVASVRIFGMD
ncbi:UNVERIFIED_CONTAM: putative mitochondrial protein [Sesamum radiatum]|uniref:Mitochondrial protein n=1 Tax=Sesamum radiatum TaxID=300843 RepID=A0AAW2IRK4_SESRA